MSFREEKFSKQGNEQNFLPEGLLTVGTEIAWVKIFLQSVPLQCSLWQNTEKIIRKSGVVTA